MTETRLSAELLNLLGPDAFTRLAEQYGGTRLFVPATDGATQLSKALGREVAGKLAARYAGSYLRVPLAREHRARQYRERQALSNAEIARKLGITETGVDRLFQRMPNKPVKGRDPRQADLFSSNQ